MSSEPDTGDSGIASQLSEQDADAIAESILRKQEEQKHEDLSDTTPAEAIKTFVEEKDKAGSNGLRDRYLHQIERAWGEFTDWFDTQDDLVYLSDLGPTFASEFKQWRSDGLAPVTLHEELKRIRRVIDYGKNHLWVRKDVPESWHLPDISLDDRKRDDSDCMDPERGTALLRRVEEQMTYTRQHVSTVLAWNYGLRRGAIATIDLSHVHLDPEKADCDIDAVPHIHMRDRPEIGLGLKSPIDRYCERAIPLVMGENDSDVIRGYIERERYDKGTDENGNKGLLTTERRPRITGDVVYRDLTKVSCPETWGEECTCETCRSRDEPLPPNRRSKCERSRSPHGWRHGAIQRFRNMGYDLFDVARIVGTSPSTLRKFYGRPSEKERMHRVLEGIQRSSSEQSQSGWGTRRTDDANGWGQRDHGG